MVVFSGVEVFILTKETSIRNNNPTTSTNCSEPLPAFLDVDGNHHIYRIFEKGNTASTTTIRLGERVRCDSVGYQQG